MFHYHIYHPQAVVISDFFSRLLDSHLKSCFEDCLVLQIDHHVSLFFHSQQKKSPNHRIESKIMNPEYDFDNHQFMIWQSKLTKIEFLAFLEFFHFSSPGWIESFDCIEKNSPIYQIEPSCIKIIDTHKHCWYFKYLDPS